MSENLTLLKVSNGMPMPRSSYQGGYIALISAVIISSLLLIITFTVNFSNFFARFNILDSEYKKVSTGLAEGCADTAILELSKDNAWQPNGGAGDMLVSIENKSCKICEVSNSGAQKIIRTRAVYQKAHTNLEVTITANGSNITVDSWLETPNYAGTCPIPI